MQCWRALPIAASLWAGWSPIIQGAEDPLFGVVKLVEASERGGGKTAKRYYPFVENLGTVVDRDNLLSLDIDWAKLQQLGAKKALVSVVVKGPHRISPLPELGKAQVRWAVDRQWAAGDMLLVDSVAAGLVHGDRIEVRVDICLDRETCDKSDEPTTTSERTNGVARTLRMRAELRDFGLTHHESDAFIFVRGSRSARWDSRPGVSAMFGWRMRGGWGADLWNFLAPRAGVNVALLDFNDDKSIEFGVGPAVSLVQGGLVFGTGWNMSTDFRRKRYVFVGISFVNIANVIKQKLEKNEKGGQ